MADKKNGIHDFLRQVIEEGVKSALAQRALTEKEKQASTASSVGGGQEPSGGDIDDLFGGGGDGNEGGDDEAPKTSKTMDAETEKLAQGDIKPKDIVDKLNSIRSGKSFKDSAVASSMEEYIQSLSKAERVALMAFLKGIAQIVTGEVPAQSAADPSDKPADVKMDKENEPKVFHKKVNIVKAGEGSPAAGGEEKKRPSAEDTTAPAPITPKRR